MSGKWAGLMMSLPAGKPRTAAISSVTFDPGRWPPRPGFRRLADLDLHRVDRSEVLRRHRIAVGDVLEDVAVGRLEALRKDAALTGAHGGAGGGAAAGEGDLDLAGQGAVGHVADVDRGVDDQRIGGVRDR